MTEELLPHVTAALLALVKHGIEPDVQELLVRGNAMRGVPPGALSAAISASLSQLVKERDEARRSAEEAERLYKRNRAFLDSKVDEFEAAERERDALREALAWFVDREAPIKSKFQLFGPADTAEAMIDAFRRARSALNLNGGQSD